MSEAVAVMPAVTARSVTAAAVDKVEVVKGLTAGMEIAVEDPTRPKEKKDDE